MNKLLFAMLALAFVLSAAPQPAEARGGVGVAIGIGCCWGGPFWGWGYPYYPAYYYPPYYPQTYYAPSTVTYAAPPPAPVTYAAPAYVDPTIIADQASPVFTDSLGRTCRQYQTTSVIGGYAQRVQGTACLQPDGSWRVAG
jgi:hypothetical protein